MPSNVRALVNKVARDLNEKYKTPKPTPITTVGDQFFIRLASELRSELAPPQLANAFTKLGAWEESIAAFKVNLRDRILAVLRGNGSQVTEKGGLEYEEDGWVFSARPWRTGYESKKVEALLRAKGQDPAKWMDAEVSYKLSDTKLGAAIQAGVITQGELDVSCKAGIDKNGEQIYALQAPKRVDE